MVHRMRRDHQHSASQRGSVAGAVVFGLVLAAILFGGYLWLEGRRADAKAGSGHLENGGTSADKWTRILGRFLDKGPEGGTWETKFLKCVYKTYVAPHPTDRQAYLLGRPQVDGSVKTRAVSRWLVPRHFFRAPASLFFANYHRSRAPITEESTGTVRVHWRPRADVHGITETERVVWFSRDKHIVLRVEDRSRTGHMTRRVRRLDEGTGDWPGSVDHATLRRVEAPPPDPHADEDQALATVVAKAPFPVYVPKSMPPGFVLVRSSYSIIPTPRDPEAKVQLVSQLYSDGVALISVGVAPRGDMDAIEMMSAAMDDTTDPAACPGLPTNPRDIREDSAMISLRTDVCRTVLRRDDLTGVSVTLIGRNELPIEEYLGMMSTLELKKP